MSREGERGERGGRRKGEEVEPREREQELTFSTPPPPPFKRSTARRRGIPRVPREAAREWKREREEEEKERRRREQNARGPFFAAASPLFLKKTPPTPTTKQGLLGFVLLDSEGKVVRESGDVRGGGVGRGLEGGARAAAKTKKGKLQRGGLFQFF